MRLTLSIVAMLAVAFVASVALAQENDQGPDAVAKFVGKPVPPAAGLTPAPKIEPGQRWVHTFANFEDPKMTADKTALVKEMKKSGYTTILVSDTKFSKLQLTDDKYKKTFQAFRKLCKDESIKLVVAVGAGWGYSETFLSHDPNLAEGQPTHNAPFVVKDGKLVPFDDGTTKLVNGSFDELNGDLPAGWETSDLGKNLFVDKDVKTDGAASIRMEFSADNGRAKLTQKIKVKPWQYYIVSAKVKMDGFSGREVRLYVTTQKAGGSYQLNQSEIDVSKASDWKTIGSRFSSQDATEVTVQVGVWGGKTGKIWWDDVKVQPGGFVNILRRESLPLTVTSEDGKTTYVEEKDFSKVADPKVGNDPRPGYWTIAHEAPVVTIPAGSALKEGQKVMATYHFPIESGKPMQMSVCLAETKVWPYVEEQVKWMKDNVDPDMYFMGFDEMRVGGWDDSCVKSGKTCGQLLADTVARMIATIKKIDPGKPVTTWNDMFDPYHNASPNFTQYYLLKGGGPWAGSWEGLSSDVVIINWARRKTENLKFFSDRGNQQILAGYYDHDKDGAMITEWLNSAKGKPGLVGVMYTTWINDFSQMKPWSEFVTKWEKANKQ